MWGCRAAALVEHPTPCYTCTGGNTRRQWLRLKKRAEKGVCHLGYQPPYTNDPNNPNPASQTPPGPPAYEPLPPPPNYPSYQPGYEQQPGAYPPPPAPPSQPLYPPPPGYPPGYGQPGYPPPPAAPSQPLYPPPPGYGPGYPGYGQPPMQPMGYGAPYYPAPREQGSDMAIAGLILGIIAIPAASFAACGVLFGALGLVFSILGLKSMSQRTMATVGIVLSSIALALALIQIIGGTLSGLSLMPG